MGETNVKDKNLIENMIKEKGSGLKTSHEFPSQRRIV